MRLLNTEQQPIIVAFTNAGAPATGLVVSIGIKKASDGSDVSPSPTTLTSIGLGLYALPSNKMPSTTDDVLAWRMDGSDTLDDADRYKFGALVFGGELEDRLDSIDTDLSTIDGIVDTINANTDTLEAGQISIASAVAALTADATNAAQISIATAIQDVRDNLTTGSGSVSGIDHDFGGTDNLRIVDGNGAAIDQAEIHIFTKTDWDNNLRTSSDRKAQSFTDINGRWTDTVSLDPATYVIAAKRPGATQVDETEFTVT